MASARPSRLSIPVRGNRRLFIRVAPSVAPGVAPGARSRARASTVSLPWIVGSCRYRGRVPTGESAFSAWSFLSLTSTAHGDLAYRTSSASATYGTRTSPMAATWQSAISPSFRDNRYVFGAGWIDSIEVAPGRKIRYRCPSCGGTDFKHRSKQEFAYRCAQCATEVSPSAMKKT